jgi:hypothetical protein
MIPGNLIFPAGNDHAVCGQRDESNVFLGLKESNIND